VSVRPCTLPGRRFEPLHEFDPVDPYGDWTAVENAALALTESANLIALPGRLYLNGKPYVLVNRSGETDKSAAGCNLLKSPCAANTTFDAGCTIPRINRRSVDLRRW